MSAATSSPFVCLAAPPISRFAHWPAIWRPGEHFLLRSANRRRRFYEHKALGNEKGICMGKIATPQEFQDAFEGLDDKERVGIMATARRYARGTGGGQEAEDLLNELIVRVLEGRRRWSTDVPILAFLALGIRSLASGERESSRNSLPHISLDSCFDDPDLRLHLQTNPHPSAEDEVSAEQERGAARSAIEFARRSLVGDPLGLQVLEGMACDMSPTEMRAAFGISNADLRAATWRVTSRLSVWAERRARRQHREMGSRINHRAGRMQ